MWILTPLRLRPWPVAVVALAVTLLGITCTPVATPVPSPSQASSPTPMLAPTPTPAVDNSLSATPPTQTPELSSGSTGSVVASDLPSDSACVESRMPPLHIQGPGELRGSVCGLDTGEHVTLQMRRYLASGELGELVLSFDVGKGPWERTGVSLEPGQYELSAQVPSPSYPQAVSYILRVPEQGVVWRADKRTFRLIGWDRAVVETGMPFCGTQEFYVPPTTPPSPLGPGIKPACGAIPTHAMVNNSEVSGSSTGLASGDHVTVSLYRLPMVDGRCYAYGFPPQEPTCTPGPERETQESAPDTEGIELVATFETAGPRWGLVGSDLTQGRYLAVVEAEGHRATPAAYAVDVPYMHLVSARVAGLDFNFSYIPDG
ncbi:MAG: hypothetical protein Q8O40_11630 [Chloroflexota bacterium]|nr:hypothetical protein [Chloroflexota bacterium]